MNIQQNIMKVKLRRMARYFGWDYKEAKSALRFESKKEKLEVLDYYNK